MARILYLNRSKIFITNDASKNHALGRGGPHNNVPDWVTETSTYKMGVKDGSVLDITPTVKPEDIDDTPVVEETPVEKEPAAPEPRVNRRKPAGIIS